MTTPIKSVFESVFSDITDFSERSNIFREESGFFRNAYRGNQGENFTFTTTTAKPDGDTSGNLTLEKVTEALKIVQSVKVPTVPDIVDSLALVEIEFVPFPRSPSRAKRRAAQGHRQFIKEVRTPKKGAFRVGDVVYMHPIEAARFRRMLAEKVDKVVENSLYKGYFGGFNRCRF